MSLSDSDSLHGHSGPGTGPDLPPTVGPLSEFTAAVIRDPRHRPGVEEIVALDIDDPLADLDFQRSLYCVHELHYRDFASSHPDAEWHPHVVDWWHRLAGRFEVALRAEVELAAQVDGSAGDAIVRAIDEFEGPSLSGFILEHASLDVLREFAIHRSAYQLKEADPHTFALPRVSGAAKAAFVEIQMDEYGNGVPGRSHAELFATSMEGLDLDSTYGQHLPRLPAATLATVNLISHLALHRRLLPALLGHLALFEMTSVGPMGRYAEAMRRVGAPEQAIEFYDVHVEADEHHGPLARTGLVDAHVDEHPDDAPLVVWGAQITMAVERRFATHLVDGWLADGTSLLPMSPSAYA